MVEPLTYTVLEACTHAIERAFDYEPDEEAKAVLKLLGIDPDASFLPGDVYVRAEE